MLIALMDTQQPFVYINFVASIVNLLRLGRNCDYQMSLVYLGGTNPRLPLFMGFDKEDSGESAGEVTERLDLHSGPTRSETQLKHRLPVSDLTVILHQP